MEVSIMSCTEGIENALNNMASAIASLCACGIGGSSGLPGGDSGGIQGTVETPVGEEVYPMIGGESPYTLPVGQEYPEDEFASLESFQDYKCAAANQIVDGAIATLNTLGALTIANMVGVAVIIGLAFASVIAFPPAGVPILIGALGFLVGGFVVMQDLADELVTNRDDLVCALYEGESTEGAIGAVMDLIDEALATLALGAAVEPHVRIVALFIFSTDTVNRLWNGLLDYAYPGADCSGCSQECPAGATFPKGSILSDSTDGFGVRTVEVQSEVDVGEPSRHIITIATDCCLHVEKTAQTGNPNGWGGILGEGTDCTETYFQWTFPLTAANVLGAEVACNWYSTAGVFTMTFELSDPV
jgi:hypothetical protein